MNTAGLYPSHELCGPENPGNSRFIEILPEYRGGMGFISNGFDMVGRFTEFIFLVIGLQEETEYYPERLRKRSSCILMAAG